MCEEEFETSIEEFKMNNINNYLKFSNLKHLLLKFLSNCTSANIAKVEKLIRKLDPDSLNGIQEIIFMPFIKNLNAKLGEKNAILCVNFLTEMFGKVQVRSWKTFVEIFTVLVKNITNPEDMRKISTVSVELKLSVCVCILNLVCCTRKELLIKMYSFTFRPNIGRAFFVLIVMLKEEKSRPLLKAMLETIGVLTYHEAYLKRERCLMTEHIASETLGSVLPGITNVLLEVIAKDDKKAHNIIIIALDVLSNLITLTLSDESCERNIVNNTSSEIYQIAYKHCWGIEINNPRLVRKIPSCVKDDHWYSTMGFKFYFYLKGLTDISSHKHWQVRLQLLKLAESVILNCNKTLKDCISFFLPVIQGLSVDRNELVSSTAKNILASLSDKSGKKGCTSLNEILDGKIEELLAQIINCELSADNNEKLVIVKRLLGHMEISKLGRLEFSDCLFKKIVLTLLTFLEFELSDINVVTERLYYVEDFNAAHALWPKKIFKFFEDEETLNVIIEIFYRLASINNGCVLIEFLLEKFLSNDIYTLPSIFVVKTVVKGFSKELDASQKYSTLIGEILEVILLPSVFDVPLTNQNNLDVLDPTRNIQQENKFQVCLLLQVITSCSEFLKTDFKVYLGKVLCAVMEKAGNPDFLVSYCGQLCLRRISAVCQYASVPDLIKMNEDYITSVVKMNFLECFHKPETVAVLQIAMEFGDAECMVVFSDLFFQFLDDLDANPNKAYPNLEVLMFVALSIKKWFPCKKDLMTDSTTNNSGIGSLKIFVKDYVCLKETGFNSESFVSNTETNASEVVEFFSHPENNYGKKPPLHVTIISKIFQLCMRFQSSEDPYITMVSVKTLEICMLTLLDYQSILLPLVHEFWVPFLRRFNDDVLIFEMVSVLLLIAEKWADFIQIYTLNDVMPKLVNFLQKKCSVIHLSSSGMYQSRMFKSGLSTRSDVLQARLLSEIGSLCTKYDIEERQFHIVLMVCLSYLKKEQPEILQEAAVRSLKALSTIDADAVWYQWNLAYSEDVDLRKPDLSEITFPNCDNSLTPFNIDFENGGLQKVSKDV